MRDEHTCSRAQVSRTEREMNGYTGHDQAVYAEGPIRFAERVLNRFGYYCASIEEGKSLSFFKSNIFDNFRDYFKEVSSPIELLQ